MEELVPLWFSCGATSIGVMYAIIRNGSRGKKQDAILKADLLNKVKLVTDQLEDPDNGLSAIKRSVDAQQLLCSNVSTALQGEVARVDEKVKRNARDLDDLRKQKPGTS